MANPLIYAEDAVFYVAFCLEWTAAVVGVIGRERNVCHLMAPFLMHALLVVSKTFSSSRH